MWQIVIIFEKQEPQNVWLGHRVGLVILRKVSGHPRKTRAHKGGIAAIPCPTF